MPGSAVAMVKNDKVWEVVVVIDDVSKVDHGFAALIAGNCQAGSRIAVLNIAVDLPAAIVLVYITIL